MTAIDPAVGTTLRSVAAVMADARAPWWVITGAAVALHGADAGCVADVDVLLDERDAARILPTIGVEPRRGTAHPLFRSRLFGTWTAPALPVEFMAGFERRAGARWVRVEPETRRGVAVEGVTVYVPERGELRAMLLGFGREKDVERARRLADLG